MLEVETAPRTQYTLRQYVRDLDRVFAKNLALPALLREIAEYKRRLMMSDGALKPEQLQAAQKPYTRNLIYADPEGRYVIVGIVWGTNSVSPVHDHGTWGVMGVYDNYIRITNYERLDNGTIKEQAQLEERESLIAPRGSVGYVLPPFQEIHRMENPTGRPTLGVHTYGKAVTACTVFDMDSGTTRELALKFDHDVTASF